MSDSEKEIENQILEAGEKLIDPPSSLDELLSLLDVRPPFTIPVKSLLLRLTPMLTVCMSLVFRISLVDFFIRLCESTAFLF